MYYITCKNCGANLDPGEKCDCLKRLNAYEERSKRVLQIDKSGQLAIRFDYIKK